MDATVYSYKMTFQTLTFRDDPRFQDGLYILVVTELAENEVNRVLYGPLTENMVKQFHDGYIKSIQLGLQIVTSVLPKAPQLTDPPT